MGPTARRVRVPRATRASRIRAVVIAPLRARRAHPTPIARLRVGVEMAFVGHRGRAPIRGIVRRDTPASRGLARTGGSGAVRSRASIAPGDSSAMAMGCCFAGVRCARCTSDAPCERGDRCVDVDGDGSGESLGLGTCSTHRDCAVERLRCATSPAERSASCEPYGGCREASDCPAGFECCDLWGDGLRECVEAGGCRSSADCPKRGIGGTHPEGVPPQCMTQPLDA